MHTLTLLSRKTKFISAKKWCSKSIIETLNGDKLDQTKQ